MRDALVKVYLHFVWGTWDRLPLINQDNEKQVYKSIIDKCEQQGASLIELGGMEDHIHLFVQFPATVSMADFIKEVKGSTSHLVTHQVNRDEFFKWQGAYAVFSVNEKDIPRIKSYIQSQADHHKNSQVIPELEI